MDERAQGRRALELDLRQAIDNAELEVFYQPIVDLGARKVIAFEALLRWRHPVRGIGHAGLLYPARAGKRHDRAAWTMGAARGLRPGDEMALRSRWGGNLSSVQFKSGSLVSVVKSALESSGLAPSRLELEITESVLLAENSINLAILHELHALGVRVCLDDFGVGYSSLSYLRSFPFKKIKIDRSFVRDVVENREAAAIIRAIAALGTSLGMAITAEGVEDEEQLEKLQQLGCDEVQGYYLSPPRPAGDVETILQKLDRRLHAPV